MNLQLLGIYLKGMHGLEVLVINLREMGRKTVLADVGHLNPKDTRPTQRARLSSANTFTLSPNAANCRREMAMHKRTARPAREKPRETSLASR